MGLNLALTPSPFSKAISEYIHKRSITTHRKHLSATSFQGLIIG